MKPNAAMLMIVPAMIWLARTEIDIQAWRNETPTAARRAAAREMRRAGVNPKIGVGSPWPTIGTTATPVTQPTNAATSIVPSMPMLTTPDRSHITPHRAAKPIGVPSWTAAKAMIGSSSTM